jgi:hypothetical protein
MAAGQNQTQTVVLLIWLRLDGQFGELTAISLIALEVIEGAARSDPLQPSPRVSRHAVGRPSFQSCDDRVLSALLRQRKIAEPAHERRRDPTGFLAEDLSQRSVS